MHNTLLKPLEIYCNDIFFVYLKGFVTYNACYLLFHRKFRLLNELFSLSTRIFPIAVFMYLLSFGVLTYYLLNFGLNITVHQSRIFGTYFWAYWLYPFLFVSMALVNFLRSIAMRMLLVVLGFIASVPIEKFIIVLRSLISIFFLPFMIISSSCGSKTDMRSAGIILYIPYLRFSIILITLVVQ